MKFMKNIYGFLFAVLVANACTSLEDTFSDFTSEPEKIYIGAPDSIFYQSGHNKVRISVMYNSDPKITQGHLTSQDGSIDQNFEIVRVSGGQDTVHLDLDLPEGTYRFDINLMDNKGNTSLTREILVNVLGDNFLRTLSSRTIEEVTFMKSTNPDETGALLRFGKLYPGLRYTRLHYLDNLGNEQSVIIGSDQEQYLIPEFQPASQVRLESYYEPVNPFNEFIAPEVAEDVLPACNTLQVVSSDISTIQFDSVNTGGISVQELKIKVPECIIGPLNLSTTAPFGLSLSEVGPFESAISIDPLSSEEVFVAFEPLSSTDVQYLAQISASATNILDSVIVSIAGNERGVNIGGTSRHPVELRSSASHIFSDDLNVFNYGTSIGNLWDGGFGWPSAIHSEPGLPIPAGFFSIDLGGDFKVREIDWMLRTDCCHERANHKYQYWGLPSKVDPATAITSVPFNGKPENKSKWEQEMFSKGWINLGNFEKSQDEVSSALNSGTMLTDVIEVVNYVRYVRVVILETFEGESATINFSELDFQVEVE